MTDPRAWFRRAWRGFWILLGVSCLHWAGVAPLLTWFLLAASGTSEAALAGMVLVHVAVWLVLAALCFWVGFRGERVALAVAEWLLGRTTSGVERATDLLGHTVGAWRTARPALVLGQPWDDLVRAAGWVTFGLLGVIPLLEPTETRRAVFFIGAGVSLVIVLAYAGVGRLYLRRLDRPVIRRLLQPFVLGAWLTLGLALFGAWLSATYVGH